MSLESQFDAVLERIVEPNGPGAAISVIRDGQFIHRKAYGLADLEWGTPLTPDGVFRIASLTKQFAAVAIMMLAEHGALTLEDPIEAHLPAWAPRGRTITIRHLLNHTSGIRSHDQIFNARTERANLRHEAVIASILAAPFDFEPGERYHYNNSGYLLLGEIIGAASGRRFEDFLKAEMFDPLGMANTRLMRHETITPRRVRGYVRGRSGFHNARPDADAWSYAAGGLGSTVDDLALWDQALRENQLIAGRTLEAMLAPTRLADGTDYPYGFGWGTAVYEGRRLFHHTGGISGFGSQMAHLRDEGLTTIVLSNLYMFPFDRVTRGLLRAGLGLPPVTAPAEAMTAADFGRCAGNYASRDGVIAVPDAGGGDLAFRRLGEGRFCQGDDAEVEFRFSDLRDGRYGTLEYVSPLWPTGRYMRSD